MKKKSVIILIAVVLSAVISTCCMNPFLPTFKTTETEEDGISVIIDGVKYKQLPEIKWYSNRHGTVIGYARDGNVSVHVIEGDTNRYLMFLQGFWDEMYVVHRTDKVIPEPSAETVDKIIWYDYIVGSDQVNNEEYTYITEDKDIIKELFKVLETGEKTTEFNNIKNNSKFINISITCYSSKVPGLHYDLLVGINNGKIICGDRYEREYAEMPLDLLEKVAGKQIDISGFTKG